MGKTFWFTEYPDPLLLEEAGDIPDLDFTFYLIMKLLLQKGFTPDS
ncbi:hypothetical protein NSP_49410 [Nodularia spumigena CCY9414]|uniref:Uncharacterized protein n=1 Tax=Nodularia spumigena 309 TaxID=2027345 RepID=A0A2P1CZ05_NODSP|nr:hypothetical protein NSP_49410 [Nodularia spumigena CCY9414]EAW45422.1 hypothetical protein N9414_22573 [Nodularia spumigena CCY9414]